MMVSHGDNCSDFIYQLSLHIKLHGGILVVLVPPFVSPTRASTPGLKLLHKKKWRLVKSNLCMCFIGVTARVTKSLMFHKEGIEPAVHHVLMQVLYCGSPCRIDLATH